MLHSVQSASYVKWCTCHHTPLTRHHATLSQLTLTAVDNKISTPRTVLSVLCSSHLSHHANTECAAPVPGCSALLSMNVQVVHFSLFRNLANLQREAYCSAPRAARVAASALLLSQLSELLCAACSFVSKGAAALSNRNCQLRR